MTSSSTPTSAAAGAGGRRAHWRCLTSLSQRRGAPGQDPRRRRAAAAVAVPLMESLGLTLADDMTSALSLPRFDNSAMDGYAVRVADSRPPCRPRCRWSARSGPDRPGVTSLSPGTVVKIMTGAPVPAGADAIVPYEWTDRGTATVIEQAPEPRAARALRRRGRTRGRRRTACGGTVLEPRHLGLLASIGHATVTCVRRAAAGHRLDRLRAPRARAPSWRPTRSTRATPSSWPARPCAAASRLPTALGIVPDDPEAFLATPARRAAGCRRA